MALKAAGLTRAATADARSYTPGDLIHGVFQAAGAGEGQSLRRPSGRHQANSVTVHDPVKGAEMTLALRQDAKLAGLLTLYTAEERSFSTGERIRFTIADKKRGIINGTRGVIEAIQPETGVTVKTDTGQRLTLALDSIAARSLDHAYASTVHDFQGSTVDRILIGLSSTERLATQKAFYVAVSRMREEAILVTDDTAALAKRITAQTGDRPTALESWLKAERERMARTAEETREREEARRGQVSTERAVEPPKQHPDRAGDAKAPAATTDQRADLGSHLDLKVERTDAEIEASLKAFADKQKQKTIEGPTR